MFSGADNSTTLFETHPEFSSPVSRSRKYRPWIEVNLPAFQKSARDHVVQSADSVLEDITEWYNSYRVYPEAPAALLNTYSALAH